MKSRRENISDISEFKLKQLPHDEKVRNTISVIKQSHLNYVHAIKNNLMQVNIKARNGKEITISNGQVVVEFINCSYLGLDVHPDVIQAYRDPDKQWGVNFCCARSRLSIEPLRELEERLSKWYRGNAITFPSVTTTHMSVMPLLASGALINETSPPRIKFIFDKFAHASMQYLKPILQQEALVTTISHNSLQELRSEVIKARAAGLTSVYVGDGVYSMGGVCPIIDILPMAEELDFYLYLDDAHGTAIIGKKGEGAVLSQINSDVPNRLFISFSMTKGFGGAGGGILVSNKKQENIIRTYGQIYAFSAPLDFASIYAAHKILDLHENGYLAEQQNELYRKVAHFDSLMNINLPFSPIRMIKIGNEKIAIKIANQILNDGFFVLVAFFPIVSRNNAQLRICIAANHTYEQISKLAFLIKKFAAKYVGLYNDQ